MREGLHTHKNTVLIEAENKPNFHRRTKGVKINSEPIPTLTNANRHKQQWQLFR